MAAPIAPRLTLARFTTVLPTLDTGALVDLVTNEAPARRTRFGLAVQHACKTGRLVVSATDQRVLADFFGGTPAITPGASAIVAHPRNARNA